MLDEDVPQGAMSYKDLLSESASDDPGVEVRPEDIHLLMYTGGIQDTPREPLEPINATITWRTPCVMNSDLTLMMSIWP